MFADSSAIEALEEGTYWVELEVDLLIVVSNAMGEQIKLWYHVKKRISRNYQNCKETWGEREWKRENSDWKILIDWLWQRSKIHK